MVKHRKLLIVIADGAHLRLVRPAGDNALHTDTALDSITAHRRASQLGTDHPGAAFHSLSAAHHAMTPRHDPLVLAKQDFAREVADVLNAAEARNGFDELVIAAPARTLLTIRKGLNGAVGARIIGVLRKDLAKTPDDELWPHFAKWVRPTHRALWA